MNRFTLFMILLSLTTILHARQIDESTARTVAINFYQSIAPDQVINESSARLIVTERTTVRRNGGPAQTIPVYYVFNMNDRGFVMVSADDSVTPIIGYSTDGTFRNTSVPAHISDWFVKYREEIKFVVENGIPADDDIKEKWTNYITGQIPKALMRKSVDPIIKTKWDQRKYYNDQCPEDAVTGCVATAMAQIMKHWNYPPKGIGSHSYDEDDYGVLSADFENTSYDWASMTAEVKNTNPAVALLMFHCGVGVEMNYDSESSDAQVISKNDHNTHCSEFALKTYFGYDPAISGRARIDFEDDSDWIRLMKKELNENRPILYAGRGEDIGHAFVCDGYDENNFFHINWGWGGNSDGYFLIDNMNPRAVGTGGGDGDGFNSGQQMLIGIMPPSSNSCGAYIAPDKWAKFMCHNLGAADTGADPFTPGWQITGGYWQWGKKNMIAPGPKGPSGSEANAGSFSVGSQAADNEWSDNYKTDLDPCPEGFRVPNMYELKALLKNNRVSRIGSWNQSSVNYSSGVKLGDKLFLPATGSRNPTDGSLRDRGLAGHYWSSTESESNEKNAWTLDFSVSSINVAEQYTRISGFAVRCIEDTEY